MYKAYDTVRYFTLLNKISDMAIPDNVYNWITNFFDYCSHCCKFLGESSNFLHILPASSKGPSLVQPLTLSMLKTCDISLMAAVITSIFIYYEYERRTKYTNIKKFRKK